jgi:dolichol kinase
MKEEKIKSLKQELKSHITPLIFNGVMSISQILILILFLPKFNGLMIFGLVGIGFGTGLSAIVHSLEISDIKKSLKSYTGGE